MHSSNRNVAQKGRGGNAVIDSNVSVFGSFVGEFSCSVREHVPDPKVTSTMPMLRSASATYSGDPVPCWVAVASSLLKLFPDRKFEVHPPETTPVMGSNEAAVTCPEKKFPR